MKIIRNNLTAIAQVIVLIGSLIALIIIENNNRNVNYIFNLENRPDTINFVSMTLFLTLGLSLLSPKRKWYNYLLSLLSFTVFTPFAILISKHGEFGFEEHFILVIQIASLMFSAFFISLLFKENKYYSAILFFILYVLLYLFSLLNYYKSLFSLEVISIFLISSILFIYQEFSGNTWKRNRK